METIQHIIIDNTLSRIGETQFADYLCHAYCYDGYCTFERNGQSFRFEAGDCLIIARRGDLVMNLKESEDFRVDVIYVTQKFIEMSTPQSNYGMRGQLFLFQNPIMKLKPEQQEICRLNFEAVKRRLKQTDHRFRHDALMNAVECMIIDFFDFHAQLYPADKISSQQHQLMEEFMAMLERGDLCRQTLRHIEISQRGLQEGERSARSVLDNPLHVARHQPIVERPFAVVYCHQRDVRLLFAIALQPLCSDKFRCQTFRFQGVIAL